jgi:hypothetical protein
LNSSVFYYATFVKLSIEKISDGTSQRTSSLSRAEPSDFGLELFFKPKSFKNQAFQA